MKRFADFLLEASEVDARKYMKAAIEKMPNVLAELQDEYGDEWVVKCFNKLRNDFVHSGCDVLFIPGIARIAYGELDYNSKDEDTAKVMMLRNIVKFITIAHKEEFSRNLEHISIVKEGPKKGSKVRSEPMTFGELDTMFSRNIEATTASAREEFERNSNANQTKYKAIWLKDFETGIDVVDLDTDEVLDSIKTTLPVAESFAKYLRDHLDEAKILPTLAAAAAIAAGAANANTHVPMHRMPDVKHGNETIYVHDVKDKPSVHGIPTSNYRLTADQYNIMADKDSSAYDATEDEVEEIYEKIKSTPKEKLSKKATDEDLKKIAYYTYKYAELYNVDVDMMLAVMSVESNFNKNANSEAGAQGLAQVMPDTQTDTFNRVLRNKKITLADINPYDVETGIRMCAAIIADLTSRIKTRDIQLIFAAYNKGWNAATAYREYRNNRPYNAADLPTETKNYVKKCMYMYKYYKASEFPKVAEELYYTPEENTEE